MKNKLLLISTISLLASSIVCAQVDDQAIKKSTGSLAGKTLKKVVLPATVIFAAVDVQAAYEKNCKHLVTEEEITACTTEHFVKEQVNDAKEIAEDVRITWKYVVVPEAKEFWIESGDDIKAGASSALDAMVDGAIHIVDILNE